MIPLFMVQESYSLPIGYENRFIEGFRYGIYIPANYNPEKKYHLMVYLHGSSDTTSWDFPWYRENLQADFPCIVLTPKCLTSYTNGWGYSWGMVESYAINMTFRIIDTVLKHYNIDTTRMHIGGTSMGGYGVQYVLASHPGMFASAFSTCGGGDPVTAPLLANTPLWIFHGSVDNVVPVSESRNMYRAILAAGGTHVRYTEYPGVGHNSWDNVGQETTLDRWLLTQQKGSVHEMPDSAESFQVSLSNTNRPKLEWNPSANDSTDDKKIWCYRIYRDSELFATLNDNKLFIIDSTAASETQYKYSVCAMNYYFNESSRSPEIAITTPSYLATGNLLSDKGSFFVYPNPVIENAILFFNLQSNSRVSIQIYNSLGQTVDKITEEVFPQGYHSIKLNTRNYSKGLYYGALETNDKKCIIKILIK